MWALLLLLVGGCCVAGQVTYVNTYSYNTTSCALGSLVAVSSNRTACVRVAGPCVNGLVVSCESTRPPFLALSVSGFTSKDCAGEPSIYTSYASSKCYNTIDGNSELVLCQGNRVRIDRHSGLGCNDAKFNASLVPAGCNNAGTGVASTLANSCEGWCPNCSYAEGVWVAVSIALMAVGAVVGLSCMLWGIRKTRARRALATWPHVQDHTPVGDMVSMDVGLIIHGLPDED